MDTSKEPKKGADKEEVQIRSDQVQSIPEAWEIIRKEWLKKKNVKIEIPP